MSAMYASSSSQKTSFACCAEAPDTLVQLARGHRAAAAGRPFQQPHAVHLDRRVLVRPARGAGTCAATSCGSSSRSAARNPISGKPRERVEKRRIPLRRAHRRRRRRARPGTAPIVSAEGAGIAVLPDVRLAVDDRGSADRRASRGSRAVPSVDAVVPDHDLARLGRMSGGARSRRILRSKCTRLCVRTTTAMPPARRSSSRIALLTSYKSGPSWSDGSSDYGWPRGSHLAECARPALACPVVVRVTDAGTTVCSW